MVIIWVIEFWVATSIELDGEQRSNNGNSCVGEETEVLASERVRRGSEVGEDEAEAETGTGIDFGQDGEDEGGGKGSDGGGRRIGGGFHGELRRVEGAAERELVRVVGEADDGGIELCVADESEVGGIGVVGEGVEEDVEAERWRQKEKEVDEDDRKDPHPYRPN